MRRRLKSLLCCLLALAMVVTSITVPVNQTTAYAEEKTSKETTAQPKVTDQVSVVVDGATQSQDMQLYLNGVYEAKVMLTKGTHTVQVQVNGANSGEKQAIEVAKDQEVYVRVQNGKVYDSVNNADVFHTATFVGGFAELTFSNVADGNTIKDWNPEDTNGDLDYVGGGLFKKTFEITALDKDLSIEYKVAFDHNWTRSIGNGSGNAALTIPAGTTKITVFADEINNALYDSINGDSYHVKQNDNDKFGYPRFGMDVSLIGTIRGKGDDDWNAKLEGYEFRQISDTLFVYQMSAKAGTYQYKVVFNHEKWYEVGGNRALTVSKDNTPVVFLYDASKEALYDSVNSSKDIAIRLGMEDEPVQGTVTTNKNGSTTFVTTVAFNESDHVQLVYADRNALDKETTIDLKKGTDSNGNFNGSFVASEVFFGDQAVDNVYYYLVNGNHVADTTQPTETHNEKQYNAYKRDAFTGRDVYVPGTFPGKSWDAATNKMTYQGNGLYSHTFENVPAGNIEYKIAMGDWSENYGLNGAFDGKNIPITLTKSQDVTVYYMDLVTHYAVTSLDYIFADISLEGKGIPEGLKFTDPGLSKIYKCTASLDKGTYKDVKAVYNGKEYKMDEFTLEEAKDVTFYFDPSTDIYYNDSVKPEIDSSKVNFNSKDTAYKSTFGAVSEDEDVTYSIETGADATKVNLIIKGKENQVVNLEKNKKDDKVTWSGKVNIKTYGQYQYFFVIYYGSYIKIYCDDDGYYGTGNLTDLTALKPYDVTVYKKGYKTPDWMKNGVVYQIFPDRFMNGTTKNDDAQTTSRGANNYEFITNWATLPENPEQEALNPDKYPSNAFKGDGVWSDEIYGGDVQGIIKRMDYLKAVGVSVIYLNPVFSSISTHRYDTTDYTKLDPILGDLGDFKELVQAAKKNDMHIVLDGVFNHVSDDSIYFDRYYKFVGKDHKVGAYPYWAYVYDYMNEKNATKEDAEKTAKKYFESKGVTDYSYTEWFEVKNTVLLGDDEKPVQDTIGDRKGKDVYGYDGWWGYDSMPVIKSTNGSEYQTGNWGKEIISGSKSIGQYWLNQGSNGWRLDVANEVSDETWQEFRESVKSLNSDNVVIGEIWTEATQYLLGDMYDSVMNYVFRNSVIAYAKAGAANDSMKVLERLRELYPKEAYYAMMNLVGSHDTSRLLSYLDDVDDDRNQKEIEKAFPSYETTSDTAKLRQYLVAFIQMTYAGAPTIYYGDEIGMVGADDPDNRRAMTWGEGNKELVEWYATMAKIRSEYSALRTGSIQPFDAKDNSGAASNALMAYTRKDKENQMIVIANNSDKAIESTISLNGLIALKGTKLNDLVSGKSYDVVDQKVTVTVPAYKGVVLTENKKEIKVDTNALKPAYDPAYKVTYKVTAKFDKTAASLMLGEQLKLKATVSPKDAADVKITWETSNAKVATVEDGVVTPVAKGTATISLNVNGVAAATCKVTVTGLEGKTTLKVTKKTSSSITLTWNKTAKATGYEVYRHMNKKWTKIKDVKETSYTDTKLVWGTSYKYKVRPYVVQGKNKMYGSDSNEVKAATASITAPSQVKNVKVSKKSNSKVEISWKKVSDATGYEVYQKTNKGTYKKIKTVNGAKNVKYTVSSLKEGYLYSFKVRAYKTVDKKTVYAKDSNVATIRMPVSAPKKVSVKRKTRTSVLINWSKVSGVSGYEIYRKTGNGSYQKLVVVKGSSKDSYQKYCLRRGTKYTFKVRAYKYVDGKKYYSSFTTAKQIRL